MAHGLLFLAAAVAILGILTLLVFFQQKPATSYTKNVCLEMFGTTVYVFMMISFPAFVLFYVVWYLYIHRQGKIYPNSVNMGFYLHSVTGSIYLLSGMLQFYDRLRQRAPRIHRWIGYLFYTMVAVTSVGILWIALLPHSGMSAQLATLFFLPLWIGINIASFRAIAVYRDVETHRMLNILGLALAASIIGMRPVTAVRSFFPVALYLLS